MKSILVTLLLSLTLFVHGQQDSTEIKLQHYKDLFVKGLITAKDYEELKQKELGLKPTQESKTTAQPTETPKEVVQSVGFPILRPAISWFYEYTISGKRSAGVR